LLNADGLKVSHCSSKNPRVRMPVCIPVIRR
jgi:hypothetical protein